MAERLKHCRHKAQCEPASTPGHFWSVNFPTTQQCKEQGTWAMENLILLFISLRHHSCIWEQENHAIAKMTARCAQYVSALKIVGLCKHKISRRLRKNLHITILSLFVGRWNYFRSIPSSVITAHTDRQTDTVASSRGKNKETNYRRYYWYHRYFKSEILVYGPSLLTSHTASILETAWRHSFPESFLRACARLPEL